MFNEYTENHAEFDGSRIAVDSNVPVSSLMLLTCYCVQL